MVLVRPTATIPCSATAALAPMLAALSTALQAPYSPARTTFVSALVAQEETGTAYAIENTTFNLQVVVGPVPAANG